MEKSIPITEDNSLIGVYHCKSYPWRYYIGEWLINNESLRFNGICASLLYNGMASRSFSYATANYEMRDVDLSEVREIYFYKYQYIKEELNKLFENFRKWIDLIPEIDVCEEDGEYKSPGIIFNDGTIYLSKELRWRYNGTLIGSYYNAQHISYYKFDRQEPPFLNQEKDYKDFPVINDFHGFTTLELERLYNFSIVKRISQSAYELLSNALENGMHWIYRSIQAANRDIYIR